MKAQEYFMKLIKKSRRSFQRYLKEQNRNPAVLIIDKDWIITDLEDRESFLLKEYKVRKNELLDLLYDEIIEHIAMFLTERYERVENRVSRRMRNYGAEKCSLHYRIEWKNENAFQDDFISTGTFKSLKDAEEEIKDYEVITESDVYRIIKVKNGRKSEVYNSVENYAL